MKRHPNQDRAHRHNALLGSNAMMVQHLLAVTRSPTATDQAKTTAQAMLVYADVLGHELRTRKD